MKKLYIDTETTGLDPKENDIIQIAIIIEIDGEIKETTEMKCAPFNPANITDSALEIQGISKEQILKRNPPEMIYNRLIKIFEKYIDRYDKTDKFIVLGQKVRFDIDFLKEFFLKNNDKYLGAYINWIPVDLLYIMRFLQYYGIVEIENLKLETMAKYFSVDLDAHDALNDIIATKEMLDKVEKIF